MEDVSHTKLAQGKQIARARRYMRYDQDCVATGCLR
jgi:hypothetical protein